MPSLSNLQVIFLGIISTELMLFFVLDGADFRSRHGDILCWR